MGHLPMDMQVCIHSYPCLLAHQADIMLQGAIHQTKHNMALEVFSILETSRVININTSYY